MTHLSRAANVAIHAVVEVGRTLKSHYGNTTPLRSKTDSAADVVTSLDIEAERYLVRKLTSYDSSIGFKGEELDPTGSMKKHWLVDPIDGTGHFIRGIPFCTTMIALIEEGVVVFAAINNFVTNELFVAEIGKGTTLNGNPIRVSDRRLNESYLSVETDLQSERSSNAYRDLRNKSIVVHTICCGHEYGLIAQGKIEGRICFDPFGKDWDYAPGSLIVTEAGGRVTNLGSNDYDYTNHNFVAANVPVHEELTAVSSPLQAYF